MHRSLKIFTVLLSMGVICSGCGEHKDAKGGNAIAKLANKMGRKSLIEDYPKVPGEDLIREISGNRLYGELQNRYTQQLVALKAETERDGAKMVVVIMSPEVGKFASNANVYGVPFIVQICANQGIDCVDITPDIAEWTSVADPRRAPVGGNWSKLGAAFCSEMLAGVLATYDGYHSTHTYPPEQRPTTFGDADLPESELDDNDNKLSSAAKTPYRHHINKQGLRMMHDLEFPKTRQRILFLGDSRIYNPYLDDEFIITERLQQRYPEKEIVNAGAISYTMDDYLSLYRQKARYCEPDVVVVCTNGADILDEYFSHRNRFSRDIRAYRPTDLERQFYRKYNN